MSFCSRKIGRIATWLVLADLVLCPTGRQRKIPNKAENNMLGGGGGANGPPGLKKIISLEPKVRLTSNQAVNLRLSFVLSSI